MPAMDSSPPSIATMAPAPRFSQVSSWLACIAVTVGLCTATARARADDEPAAGAALYRDHCARCHGPAGDGTSEHPLPLVGDLSVAQLARYIDDTMPEDDPSAVAGEAARTVAEHVHAAFYSPIARDRNRPARVEHSRLTVAQHRAVAADLLLSLAGTGPGRPATGGLLGRYCDGWSFDPKREVFQRIDPTIDFDFGIDPPRFDAALLVSKAADPANARRPQAFDSHRFAIRWEGSVFVPEGGDWEFVVASEHSVKLFVNDFNTPLIDAYVQSGAATEHRGRIRLLGGRAYPLLLHFVRANRGVDNVLQERFDKPAAVRLAWKPPHGAEETIPARRLAPALVPTTFVLATAFPPDDRSAGYERATAVSREWFDAAVDAAVEITDHVVAKADQLAGTRADAGDRAAKLEALARRTAELAFRRPLDAREVEAIGSAFAAGAADPLEPLEQSLLATFTAPSFLHREPAAAGDSHATAARLAFTLWDSLPDATLREAAAAGRLASPGEIRAQAERMAADPRANAKLTAFLLAWMRVDLPPEIAKDRERLPEFTPEIAADLRTSLLVQVESLLGQPKPDLRTLLLDDTVWVNPRLAPLYGVRLDPPAGFTPVRLDEGQRAGVVTHPYLMTAFSYAGTTSPIHRGVWLARNVLGNVLRPPPEAVAPLPPDLHPDLATRQRVELQTAAVACQGCHIMINPLGFALEQFDPLGRLVTEERGRPIDAGGSYQPRQGEAASFDGGRALAEFLTESADVHESFVRQVFQFLVRQPILAWGPDTPATLGAAFAASGYDIRGLAVEAACIAALPPPLPEEPVP